MRQEDPTPAAIEEPANARSRRTRSALLAATRALLEEGGFESLTMAAVAERAGVTRRALYLHFNRRADLVNALFDYIAETEGLAEATGRVWHASDSVAALDQWAHLLATYHVRLLAVTRAVEREHRLDPDAARHRSRVVRAQVANCRRLAGWLDRDGRLAAPWTVATATDMLWALISTDLIEGLIVDRRWSPRRVDQHLATLFRRTFVAS